MKLWLDEHKSPPVGFNWYKSTDAMIRAIESAEKLKLSIDIISVSVDSVEFLEWFKDRGSSNLVEIHSRHSEKVSKFITYFR